MKLLPGAVKNLVFVCQFFVEDPGGPTAEVLTTFPPEVLISTPPTNLTNASLLDYPEENTAEIKFYLPVSAEINTSVSYKYS